MHGHRFGHGPWQGRMFRKGDFKYMILDMLREKPRYGYEIIRELEDKFGGLYVPSAGIVYPTLQYLEELGYVTGAERDGKKVYTVTDEGRKFLESQKETVDGIHNSMKSWCGAHSRDEFHELMRGMGRLGKLCFSNGRSGTPEQIKLIRKVIDSAYEDIDKIFKK